MSKLPRSFHELLAGSAWLVISAVLGQGAMLIASLIVANLLGVINFGRYALLQSTVVTLAGIAQLSLAVVTAQQLSALREKEPALAGEVAAFSLAVTGLLSLLFTLALIIGRGLLAEALFRDSSLSQGIAIAAIALPWVAISALQHGLFNGLNRFRDQAVISLVTIPLVIVLPTIGAWWGGLEGGLIGLALVYFTRSVVAHVRIRVILRREGIFLTLPKVRSKAFLLVNHSLPATLSGLATMFAVWGGQTLLMRSEGGPTAVGMFAAAFSIKTIVMFVPAQMLGALMPALSRGHGRGEVREMRRLLYFNAGLAVSVAILLVLACIPLAPRLISVFGSSFLGGESTLRILLLATPLEALTITLYQDLQSRGQFWKNFICVNLPLALTVLLAALWLVPLQLADGLALAWLIGWGVALICILLALNLDNTL